jgi:hypothetical protein
MELHKQINFTVSCCRRQLNAFVLVMRYNTRLPMWTFKYRVIAQEAVLAVQHIRDIMKLPRSLPKVEASLPASRKNRLAQVGEIRTQSVL